MVKLNLWNNLITALKPGSTCRLTHLSARKVNEKISITTTKSTSVTQVDDMENADADYTAETSEEEDTVVTVHASIIRLQIVQMWECLLCHRTQGNFSCKSNTHRCINCKLLQKSSSYRPISRGTMCLDSNNRVSISNAVL